MLAALCVPTLAPSLTCLSPRYSIVVVQRCVPVSRTRTREIGQGEDSSGRLSMYVTAGAPRCTRYMLGAENLVDAFVAEHVWEHLSLPDAHRATRNCERHLRPGGRLRIAVPGPAWYSASAGPSSTLSDEDQGTALRSQTESSASSDVEKARIGGNGTGDSLGGGIGGQNGEGESLKDITLGDDEVSKAGRTAIPAGLDLPGWLSHEMLMADARDRHLVQFTPELLANVCWSAGLIPFLLEGGGANDEGFAGPAAKTAGESGDEDAEVNHAAGSDKERGVTSGLLRQKAPTALDWFPTAGENDVEGRQQHHLWGYIGRSAAGGDPRGAVSIVMDCVKPEAGKDDFDHHPESSEAGFVTDDQPVRRDAESRQRSSSVSEGLASTDSEDSSHPPYSLPSQQEPPVSSNSLAHAEHSRNRVEANRTGNNGGAFGAAVAAGITSGIGPGPGPEGSVAGGVVALGKGATATGATAAANGVDGSYDIVVRPVASRPKESSKHIDQNSNRVAGHGHAFGGGGMVMGTAMSSCRGLLCDGGGQSDDAAGSGEGG